MGCKHSKAIVERKTSTTTTVTTTDKRPSIKDNSLNKTPIQCSHLSAPLTMAKERTEIIPDGKFFENNATAAVLVTNDVDRNDVHQYNHLIHDDDDEEEETIQDLLNQAKGLKNQATEPQKNIESLYGSEPKSITEEEQYRREKFLQQIGQDNGQEEKKQEDERQVLTNSTSPQSYNKKETHFNETKDQMTDRGVVPDIDQEKVFSSKNTYILSDEEDDEICSVTSDKQHDGPIKMESIRKLGAFSLEHKVQNFIGRSRNDNFSYETDTDDEFTLPSFLPPLAPMSPSNVKTTKNKVDNFDPKSLYGSEHKDEDTHNITESQTISDDNDSVAESSVKSLFTSPEKTNYPPSPEKKSTRPRSSDSPYSRKRLEIQEEMQKGNPMEQQLMNLIQSIENGQNGQKPQVETGYEQSATSSNFMGSSATSISSLGQQSNSSRRRRNGGKKDHSQALLMAQRLQYLPNN